MNAHHRCPRRRLIAVLLACAGAAAAPAATITVTGTGDTISLDGLVTLREAILAANSNAAVGDAPAGSFGADTIHFGIAGTPGAVHTITPFIALPTITEAVTIDGYTQIGAFPNSAPQGSNALLKIVLDGQLAGFNSGLTLFAGNSAVRGLVIQNFHDSGILVTGSGNSVRGNFIGSDANGNLDRGNGACGVTLAGANNLVGGTAPADRNLVSGNDFCGVAIAGAGIGGNRIEGNLIGTRRSVDQALPNGGDGVRYTQAAGNTVGGNATGAGNVIAFNAGAGVLLAGDAGSGSAILRNAIRDNGGIGIDLAADGVTANDIDDIDAGPNGRQNFPVLLSATVNGDGTTTVDFVLDSAPVDVGQPFEIQFFVGASCDASGHGEAQGFLGSGFILAQANESYRLTIAAAPPAGQRMLVATATNLAGSSSEFSPCRALEPLFANGFE